MVERELEAQEQAAGQSVLGRLVEAPRQNALALAAALIFLIALVDSQVHGNYSIGTLYIVAILIASPFLRGWQLFPLAAFCAFLREHYAPFGWEEGAAVRVFYVFVGYLFSGLFAHELARNRRMVMRHYKEMREQIEARQEAEKQLRGLIDSSPAAILTLDSGGRVDLANHAAHQIFDVPAGELRGRDIGEYLPVIADLLAGHEGEMPYRAATNCRGRRAGGEAFLACVWFATFPTREGTRLAAIITDASEDLRDWQETSLQSLLRSTRVLVGSVSHEIRNICAAISVVHANLGRMAGVAETEDYAALGTLAQGLAKLTTVELQSGGDADLLGSVNLETLLEEFRIVMGPSFEAEDVELSITIAPGLPEVTGDHHGLLQVLLNLGRNSLRAMNLSEERRLRIAAGPGPEGAVLVRLQDCGPGVASPEKLFQPFQQGAEAVGLGLFVSRAIVRACEGELYYEPSPEGCTMCLKLKPFTGGESHTDNQATEVSA
jgi:two-component system, LuxR family, sensor kinase FixL